MCIVVLSGCPRSNHEQWRITQLLPQNAYALLRSVNCTTALCSHSMKQTTTQSGKVARQGVVYVPAAAGCPQHVDWACSQVVLQPKAGC